MVVSGTQLGMAKSIDDTNPGFPLGDVGLCDGSLYISHNVGLRDFSLMKAAVGCRNV